MIFVAYTVGYEVINEGRDEHDPPEIFIADEDKYYGNSWHDCN